MLPSKFYLDPYNPPLSSYRRQLSPIKICQELLKTNKLPYLFVQALYASRCSDPAKLKMACHMWKTSGPYYQDLLRVMLP